MFQYFSLLNKKEVLKLEEFIDSPYFNSVKNLSRLFQYLKSLYPDIKPEDIENKKIHKVIYGGKKFDDVKIRKLKSDFKKIFDNFLSQLEYERERDNFDLYLLRSYRKKGIWKEFNLFLRELKNKTSDNQIFSKDDNYYLNQIHLNHEEFYFNSNNNYNLESLLQSKSDNLDHLFSFMKLHNCHEMILKEYESGSSVSFQKNFSDEIIEFVKRNRSEIELKHPNLFIIYLVYRMFAEENEEYVNLLKKYLKKNEKRFSRNQLGYYYKYLESYYWKKINDGFTEFREELFVIYKLMIKKEIFALENFVSNVEFNNVINAALPLGEYVWIENFIEENKKYLKSEIYLEPYNLAKAKLFFYSKQFEKALHFLNEVSYTDSFYFLNSKLLLARTFYELNNFEGIYYIITQLYTYAKRHEVDLSKQQLKSIMLFNKFFKDLLRLKNEFNKSDLHILKKEIANEKHFLSGKNWFLEKISELDEK